jgi:hypothetical protein
MTRFVLAVLVSLGASAAFADEPLVCRSVVDPSQSYAVNCSYTQGYFCDSTGNNCQEQIGTLPGCSNAVYKTVCLPKEDWVLDNGARPN